MKKFDLMEKTETKEEFQAIIRGISGAEIKSPIFISHKEAVNFITKWLGEGEDRGLMEERHECAIIRAVYYEDGLIQSEKLSYYYEW